jgi:hypothetical protein
MDYYYHLLLIQILNHSLPHYSYLTDYNYEIQFVQIVSDLYTGMMSSTERRDKATTVFTYNNWSDNTILCFIAIGSQKIDKYRVRAFLTN